MMISLSLPNHRDDSSVHFSIGNGTRYKTSSWYVVQAVTREAIYYIIMGQSTIDLKLCWWTVFFLMLSVTSIPCIVKYIFNRSFQDLKNWIDYKLLLLKSCTIITLSSGGQRWLQRRDMLLVAFFRYHTYSYMRIPNS